MLIYEGYFPLEHGALNVKIEKINERIAYIRIEEDSDGWKMLKEAVIVQNPEGVGVIESTTTVDYSNIEAIVSPKLSKLAERGLSLEELSKACLYMLIEDVNKEANGEYDSVLYEIEDEFEDILEKMEDIEVW